MDSILHPDYIGGFDLTPANCTNGTFTNRKTGQPTWATVNGLQPTFATVNGIEGVQCANNAGQAIVGDYIGQWQGTVIVTARPESTSTMALMGGTSPTANTFALLVSNYKLKTLSYLASGYTAAFPANSVQVFSGSWSPTTGKTYSQVGSNAVVLNTSAPDKKNTARIAYPYAGIGVHRTTYFTGWITRLSCFAKPLHETDPAGLADMIAFEAARVA